GIRPGGGPRGGDPPPLGGPPGLTRPALPRRRDQRGSGAAAALGEGRPPRTSLPVTARPLRPGRDGRGSGAVRGAGGGAAAGVLDGGQRGGAVLPAADLRALPGLQPLV